jgi:hypothetical protein
VKISERFYLLILLHAGLNKKSNVFSQAKMKDSVLFSHYFMTQDTQHYYLYLKCLSVCQMAWSLTVEVNHTERFIHQVVWVYMSHSSLAEWLIAFSLSISLSQETINDPSKDHSDPFWKQSLSYLEKRLPHITSHLNVIPSNPGALWYTKYVTTPAKGK